MHRATRVVGLVALAVSLAACGSASDTTSDAGIDPASGTCLEGTPDCDDTGILDGDDAQPPSAGMCAPGVTDCDDTGILVGAPGSERCLPEAVDCDDTPGQDEPAGDVFDSESAIAQAEALLGLADTELASDVRVGRQGEEAMMLTEDYVLGRLTVELDLDDMDRWIVTAVTVELPDGPQTFTRHLT